MPGQDDFYASMHIDEQVDALWLAQGKPAHDQRLAADLRDILAYGQEDARSLDAILQKLLQETDEQPGQNALPIERHVMQEKPLMMLNRPSSRSTRHIKPVVRVLAAFAAVLVAVALIGGMLVILHASQQSASQPTPIVNEGKSVYHTGNLGKTAFITWSPDGQRIAAASEKLQSLTWQISSWDALTGQHVVNYPTSKLSSSGAAPSGAAPFRQLAWSPDGNRLAVLNWGNQVDIFDARSGKLINTLLASGVSLSSQITWSPDSQYLAESASDSVLVWNVTTGSLVKSMLLDHIDTDIFWEPYGNQLAVLTHGCVGTPCRQTKLVYIWDTTTWHLVKQYQDIGSILGWSLDGKQLALLSLDVRSVLFFNALTGHTVKWLDTSRFGLNQGFNWSPNSRQFSILSPDQKNVLIVNTLTGQTVKQLTIPPKWQVASILWSPDGSRLAEEGSDGTGKDAITVWSTDSGKRLYTFPQNIDQAIWSPDGKYIACAQYMLNTSKSTYNVEIVVLVA